jgi:hypothetical protein
VPTTLSKSSLSSEFDITIISLEPGEASVTDLEPGTIARTTAAMLAAEMCPGVPDDVGRILAKGDGSGADGFSDGGDLASLIVAASYVGCRLYADLRRRTDRPAAVYLEQKLRREMGIDVGLSDDLDRMIEAVVDALMQGRSR